MKRLLLASLFALSAACTSSGGADYLPPDAHNTPRLTRDVFGSIRDRLLGNQECWMRKQYGTCQVRCFPENIYKACANGIAYFYSRPTLQIVLNYGTVAHLADPGCGGDVTAELVKVSPDRPTNPVDCISGADLSPSLNDRYWYQAYPPDVDPALLADLPPNR